jgi:excisionase family DNA binding protein
LKTEQETVSSPVQKLLVTISEAGDSLGVKRSTIYEFIRCGKIRTVKIGTRGIRVPTSELARFVNEGLSLGGSNAN